MKNEAARLWIPASKRYCEAGHRSAAAANCLAQSEFGRNALESMDIGRLHKKLVVSANVLP
jgi:hypothetical protein